VSGFSLQFEADRKLHLRSPTFCVKDSIIHLGALNHSRVVVLLGWC
jgi:hypothetical protein